MTATWHLARLKSSARKAPHTHATNQDAEMARAGMSRQHEHKCDAVHTLSA
nr:MAG TPA: hypothetical protein [Caudoviricetes sp.]